MKTSRCAIYTRKSSDDGLEQDFNSLDAQREACAAYVLSQASEGWKLLPEQYDDGGISGGTLNRPALQRLLADVAERRIDTIVIYKVDRLTRSLLDFAKLVEVLDRSDTSFVSVTQSFNTTTSMGRLTLNMLLSFAQFEREVTTERIRDKIAASKAKGMWMGGTPPLGYEPNNRSLAIVEKHAAIVRDIYQRYQRLGNVRLVADTLADSGIISPRRVTLKGRSYGGCTFSRGQLYTILRNPIYAGDIRHKEIIYPGNHPAIIEREDWDNVQAQLANNVKGIRSVRSKRRAMLAGLLFDENGQPLISVHTSKGKQRYRYYVSKAQHHGNAASSAPALRLPAREIEQVVRQEITALLADPFDLLMHCKLDITPAMLGPVSERCAQLSADIVKSGVSALGKLGMRVAVHPDRLELSLIPEKLADLLKISVSANTPTTITHPAAVRLSRTGRAVRLVQDNGLPASNNTNPYLVRLLLKARYWWSELAKGECDITTLSRREKVTAPYMGRVVKLAFLAPELVQAVLTGNTRANLNTAALLAAGAISARWEEQVAEYLPEESSGHR